MRYCMVLQGERVVVTRFFDALAAALRSQVVPQAFSPEMLDWAPRKVRWWRFWAAKLKRRILHLVHMTAPRWLRRHGGLAVRLPAAGVCCSEKNIRRLVSFSQRLPA